MMYVARLEALKSFDSLAVGDMLDVILDERWAHLIANDYVRMVGRWPLEPPPDITYGWTSSRPESSL